MKETLTYSVPNMSCEHCTMTITGALTALPSVQDVAVYLNAQRVTVTGENLDDQALRRALEKAGYETE